METEPSYQELDAPNYEISPLYEGSIIPELGKKGSDADPATIIRLCRRSTAKVMVPSDEWFYMAQLPVPMQSTNNAISPARSRQCDGCQRSTPSKSSMPATRVISHFELEDSTNLSGGLASTIGASITARLRELDAAIAAALERVVISSERAAEVAEPFIGKGDAATFLNMSVSTLERRMTEKLGPPRYTDG